MVVVVPDKAHVYPEFVGRRRPAGAHAGVYEKLLQALADENIPAADLRSTLMAGKLRRPTYLRTDTHWTPWGARLAAREISAVVHRAGLGRRSPGADYVTRLERTVSHRGDLLTFLPLEPYFKGLLPQSETIEVMQTEAADRESGMKRQTEADLFGDAALPDVALVGTSFSANPLWNFAGFLEESLQEGIANYARPGAGPFQPMAAYLQGTDFHQRPPRLVIWEIPERALLRGAAASAPGALADAR